MNKNKTVRQFAADFEVHPNTVYEWIKSGKMPCLKAGGMIRIRPQDEDVFYKRCEFDAGEVSNDERAVMCMPSHPSKDAYEMGVSA